MAPGFGRQYRSPMKRRRRAGGARWNPPSGCWPIPASAASGRVAGAAARRPEFVEGVLPDLIFSPSPAAAKPVEKIEDAAPNGRRVLVGAGRVAAPAAASALQAYWLLSLFAPTAGDGIEWERGAYSLVARGGRVESPVRSGELKKLQNMVSEGSVGDRSRRPARLGGRCCAGRISASCLSRRLRRRYSHSAGAVMRYRLTCLTPVLVGDGEKLSAIDYMVWKDHVSVLDQRRIFRLLAKGPRLEGYLTQLKKADKLDFASWGGFAQNFADRRIPFEHASSSAYWERASGESLNIPTFASGASGPYLPGAAIKGTLRTGMLFAGLKPGMLRDVAAVVRRRPPAQASRRRPRIGGAGILRT